VLANWYGRHVLVFFLDSTKSELSPFNDFMVAMFVLKKSSETLPLCPKRREHDVTTYYENPSSMKLLIIIFSNNILLI
jgi:hypothetical protein